MKLGKFDLRIVSDGLLWLDGGAMFGVVPKSLWERRVQPDSSNRIPLGTNCLLIRTPDHTVLIDTGCGHKYSAKEIEIYKIEHQQTLLSELSQHGVEPSEVDLVINTHLHFDHCGGNTRLDAGEVVPTFPRARYIVRRQEYEDANHPNERTRATYFQHNWEPLEKNGQLELIEEDTEVVPGITTVLTPGHTLGHQSIRIESQGQILFYMADLCPTSNHLPLPWIMGYDLYPMTTLQTRKKIYPKAVEEGWLLFFEHDPTMPCGNLHEEDGKYILRPRVWED